LVPGALSLEVKEAWS